MLVVWMTKRFSTELSGCWSLGLGKCFMRSLYLEGFSTSKLGMRVEYSMEVPDYRCRYPRLAYPYMDKMLANVCFTANNQGMGNIFKLLEASYVTTSPKKAV